MCIYYVKCLREGIVEPNEELCSDEYCTSCKIRKHRKELKVDYSEEINKEQDDCGI